MNTSTCLSTGGECIKGSEIVKEVRDLLQYENTILNHRIGWMSAVEGLLFAGFGMLFPKPFNVAHISDIRPILLVYCFTGLAVAFLAFVALLASSKANERLFQWWRDHKPKDYDGVGVLGWSMPDDWKWQHYATAWNFIPVILMIAWGALICELV